MKVKLKREGCFYYINICNDPVSICEPFVAYILNGKDPDHRVGDTPEQIEVDVRQERTVGFFKVGAVEVDMFGLHVSLQNYLDEQGLHLPLYIKISPLAVQTDATAAPVASETNAFANPGVAVPPAVAN